MNTNPVDKDVYPFEGIPQTFSVLSSLREIELESVNQESVYISTSQAVHNLFVHLMFQSTLVDLNHIPDRCLVLST